MKFHGSTLKFQIIVLLMVLAGFGVTIAYRPVYMEAGRPPSRPKKPEVPKEGPFHLVRVVDGDTIVVASGAPKPAPPDIQSAPGEEPDAFRVRYLGINTPEKGEKFFREATDTNRELLGGKAIYLEYEGDREDVYGRKLAYVYSGKTPVNRALLEAGMAHLFVIPPARRHYDEFLKAEKAAREAAAEDGKPAPKGIWALKEFQSPLHITSFHANPRGDESRDPNLEYLRVCNITLEPLSLKGFKIRNRRGKTYRFPDITLPPGYTAVISSGAGEDQTDPAKPIDLHWGARYPVWSNRGDTAVLYSPEGKRVDSKSYQPGGPERSNS